MKIIVVAPKESHKFLLEKYRNEDIFTEVKFLTREEIIKGSTFSYTNEAAVYLIKNHDLTYEIAKIYLSALVLVPEDYKGSNEKILNLLSLQKELKEHQLLIKDELFNFDLAHSQIYVHYYDQNDKQLAKYLEKFNKTYISQDDGHIREVYKFASVEDELYFVMNSIEDLIKNGVSPSKIKIANINDNYMFPLRRMSQNFGININNCFCEPLIASPIIRKLINNFPDFYGENNYDEFFEEFTDYSYLPDVINILKTFKIEDFSFEKQLKLYEDVFKTKNITPVNKKEAIRLVNEPYACEGEYLFILNFSQANFPSYKRDDGYLSNSDLEEISQPSIESTNASLSIEYENVLKQSANIVVTFPEVVDGVRNLNNPYIKKFGLDIVENPTLNNIYSLNEFHLSQVNLKDLARKYRQQDEVYFKSIMTNDLKYQDYSFQVDKISHFTYDQVVNFSYSSFDLYQKCAYSYYLQKVLKIREYEPSFLAKFGIIVHYVLENLATSPDKSARELYENAFRDKTVGKELSTMSIKDKFMADNLIENIENICSFIKDQHTQIQNPEFFVERKYDNCPVDDNLKLNGRIDKLITFGDNKRYLAIIDYKTGDKTIEPDKVKYGLSNQLPFYSLLLEYNKDENKKVEYDELFGFFIQPAMFLKFDSTVADLRLCGECIDDKNVINKFDNNFAFSGSGKYLRVSLKKDGSYDKFSHVKNVAWFKDVIKTTRDLIVQAKKKVLNNEFLISPKIYKEENVSCKYCEFRDVCYFDHTAEIVLENGEEENVES